MTTHRVSVKIRPEDLQLVGGKLVVIKDCPKCKTKKDINDFGFRHMSDDVYRRQSYCRDCRRLPPTRP
jgi:hypothetical protein